MLSKSECYFEVECIDTRDQINIQNIENAVKVHFAKNDKTGSWVINDYVTPTKSEMFDTLIFTLQNLDFEKAVGTYFIREAESVAKQLAFIPPRGVMYAEEVTAKIASTGFTIPNFPYYFKVNAMAKMWPNWKIRQFIDLFDLDK